LLDGDAQAREALIEIAAYRPIELLRRRSAVSRRFNRMRCPKRRFLLGLSSKKQLESSGSQGVSNIAVEFSTAIPKIAM
jgi:hypothetical protein